MNKKPAALWIFKHFILTLSTIAVDDTYDSAYRARVGPIRQGDGDRHNFSRDHVSCC